MPSDRGRGGLVGVKRPLVSATSPIDPELERTILPPDVTQRDEKAEPQNLFETSNGLKPRQIGQSGPASLSEEMTKPATFHLPLSLLQRLRATCRLKDTTMVEFVRLAIEDALKTQRPTRDEINRLLGTDQDS
jgi:hypothetical protein